MASPPLRLPIRRSTLRAMCAWLLALALAFTAASGIGGGSALVSDPLGVQTGLSTELLANTPFADFMVPGLLLLVVIGGGSSVALYLLIVQPRAEWLDRLRLTPEAHGAWTVALAVGITLFAWMGVQVALIGLVSVLQVAYGLLALVIIALALAPLFLPARGGRR